MTTHNFLEIDSWFWVAWAGYWFFKSFSNRKKKVKEDVAPRLRHLVSVGLGFILIFNPDARTRIFGSLPFNETAKLAGCVLTALGLGLAIWARVHLGQFWSGTVALKPDHRLIQTGPYKKLRHPIYSGLLLAVVGSVLSAATGDGLFGLVLIVMAYLRKILREEEVLRAQFGEEYQKWRSSTWALIPFLF